MHQWGTLCDMIKSKLTLTNITSPGPLPEQHGRFLRGGARSKVLLGVCKQRECECIGELSRTFREHDSWHTWHDMLLVLLSNWMLRGPTNRLVSDVLSNLHKFWISGNLQSRAWARRTRWVGGGRGGVVTRLARPARAQESNFVYIDVRLPWVSAGCGTNV
jgi:hypothetical protein